MLFLLPGSASPIRLHNAIIELGEIEKIMNHITDQPKPDEIHLPEINKVSSDGDFSVDDGSGDELLYEAAKIVMAKNFFLGEFFIFLNFTRFSQLRLYEFKFKN